MAGFDAKNLSTTAVRQLYADPAAAAAQATDKIAAARVWLLKEKPFFGVLARALIVESTLSVTAFRLTSLDKLLANALVVLELPFPALTARIAHLTLHAALGAFVRRGPREALRWNAAHDLAIEPLLRAAGLASPAAALPSIDLPPGASAEEYFELLPEGTRPDDAWCDLSDPPPPPDAPPAGNYTRQDDGEGNDPGEGKSNQNPRDDQHERDEGDEEEDEEGKERQERGSEDTVEARGRALQWKMRLAAALEEEIASGGKTFGEVPAWIEELVRATIEPPPHWTADLARSIAMLTRTDRSFLRPSRRQAALAGEDGSFPDLVSMPGRRIVPAGSLVSVIDTSGSIDSETLSRFLGSLASIATAEGFDEVRLIQADAEVTRDETVFASELLFREVSMVGGGGTDFGPALRMLELESLRDRARYTVVYLTDLDGKFPDAREVKMLDVLWVVPGKAPKAPPFGKLVEMALR